MYTKERKKHTHTLTQTPSINSNNLMFYLIQLYWANERKRISEREVGTFFELCA